MNAEEIKFADELYAKGVNLCVMIAQQAALHGNGEQRDEFCALAHELRQKRFKLNRVAMVKGGEHAQPA